MKVTLINYTKPEDEKLFQVITDTARVSYRGVSKGEDADLKLFKRLFNDKHTSPFEFVYFTFLIEDCPLFVRSQIQRHRTFSYSEVSGRYTEFDYDKYLIPTTWRKQHKSNKQMSGETFQDSKLLQEYVLAMNAAFDLYKKLIQEGVSREMARMVLPLGTLTDFRMTGNLNNWIKFLKLRTAEDVQQETREVALEIQKQIFQQIPELGEIWQSQT